MDKIDISKCKRSACATDHSTTTTGIQVLGLEAIKPIKYIRGLAAPKASSKPLFTITGINR